MVLSVLVVVVMSVAYAGAAAPAQLYVYLSTPVSSRLLQKRLNESLSGVDVTVFGRFRDFEKTLKTKPPDAVLALGPVIHTLGFEAALRGNYRGSNTENWVLLSPGNKVSLADATNMRIAAVDILGRRGTSRWVGEVLASGTTPRLTRVARTEDLLPLLSLEAADLLLVPERVATRLKRISKLQLHSTSVGQVGLVQLAVVGDGRGGLVAERLREIGADLNQIIGVSEWK